MSIKNKHAGLIGVTAIGFASGLGLGALGAPFWLIVAVAGGLSCFYAEDVGETACSLFGGNKES